MINSRHTGMIIWIIKILRRLHDTFYKQNALSLAFRQRVGIILKTSENPIDKGNSEVFFFLRFSNDTIIFFLNSSDVMCRIKNEYLFFESKSQVP